jgi:GNAT superfamily N-acetyltransferase
MSDKNALRIRAATAADVSLILGFIRELAEYEKLSHEVVATEADIHASLFGPKPVAECVLAELHGQPVGFALFFHNFSTFLGRPGIYLEDLYVRPTERGKGIGRKLLAQLAQLAVERRCGRLEWAVLDWNEPAIRFYENLGARILKEWRINRLTGKALENMADEVSK